MTSFIIDTKNYVTKLIAIKAIKTAIQNQTFVNESGYKLLPLCDEPKTTDAMRCLYRKACMKGDVIVINSLDQMKAWRFAISNYRSERPVEGKILRVLKANAVRGLKKRM